MNSDELRALLQQPEGPTLEFKRKWYKGDSDGPERRESLKHEMVKDILALANGNDSVAGEAARLVIGADDTFNAQGSRDTWDVPDRLTDLEIRDTVNNFCDPPVDHIYCEAVLLDGKRLYVVTLPASPHVHETTRKLTTPKASYDPYTVFERRASGIEQASTKERVALQQLKRLRYTDLRNAPPAGLGAVAGATVGALIVAVIVDDDPTNRFGTVRGGLFGGTIGAIFGGFVGWQFNNGSVRTIWNQLPPTVRLLGLLVFGLAGTFGGIFFKRIGLRIFRISSHGNKP